MSRKASYSIHDYVFSQYEDSGYWPSKVIKINESNLSGSYDVYLYGLHCIGTVTDQEMCPYEENWRKVSNFKDVVTYNLGMKEIKAEIIITCPSKASTKKKKKATQFSIHDFVFTKYTCIVGKKSEERYWPCKIVAIDTTMSVKRYFVYYYNRRSVAVVVSEQMDHYIKGCKTVRNDVNYELYNTALNEMVSEIESNTTLAE